MCVFLQSTALNLNEFNAHTTAMSFLNVDFNLCIFYVRFI